MPLHHAFVYGLLIGATMVLTPFVFALAMGWIGENGKRELYKRYKRYTRQESPSNEPVPGKVA